MTVRMQVKPKILYMLRSNFVIEVYMQNWMTKLLFSETAWPAVLSQYTRATDVDKNDTLQEQPSMILQGVEIHVEN